LCDFNLDRVSKAIRLNDDRYNCSERYNCPERLHEQEIEAKRVDKHQKLNHVRVGKAQTKAIYII